MKGKLKKEDWGWVVEFDVNEDEVLNGDASSNDTNTENLIYSVTSGTNNGTVVMEEDGSFTYTPNPDYNGR